MNLSHWETELTDVMPRMIELRRELHRHPELSGQEKNTQRLILNELASLDIETYTFESCYGVMGILRNGVGPCIAVRADMDALPIQETTGLAFASEVEGVMHACGHDAHGAGAGLGHVDESAQGSVAWYGEVAL